MNLPPYGDQFRRVDSFFSTLKVKPTDTPSMKLDVSAGGFWLNSKTFVEFKGGLTPDFTAPTADSKWCLLVLNHSGNLRIVDGAQSTSPQFPNCPENCFPLTGVFLGRTDTAIKDSMIFDIRGIFTTGVLDHNALNNREFPDCHTVDSITDLRDILDNLPTNDDIRNAMMYKADHDGTIAQEFILNKDQMGTPVSDVSIIVERGSAPNVFFRWNEGLRCWEYTNDGSATIQLTNIGPSILFPPATYSTIGGIMVGDRLSIDSVGNLGADLQSEENFTAFYKTKLDGIAEQANKYVHPTKHQASEINQELNLRFMTDAERLKLTAIEENANKYIHPISHSPNVILEDAMHRFTTDTDKAKLDGIEEGANRYEHPTTHLPSIIVEDQYHRWFTDVEKLKLANIAENANNYVHPAQHEAIMIVTDELHRFVTETEKSTWNGKPDFADIDARIDAIIGLAPEALDTLGEISTALGEDPDFAATMTTALSGKVDKVAGKQLSTEDYTTLEKDKLSLIEDNANFYVHPAEHPASMVVEDAARRFVTDLEKTKLENVPTNIIDVLNNKVDVEVGKGLSTEDFTTLEKTKLSTLENYVHPVNHPPSIILEDATHRFVTDTEKVTWNDKDKYSPANGSMWATAPTTVGQAIDALASAVYALRGNVAI
jgi:hypothetical protein